MTKSETEEKRVVLKFHGIVVAGQMQNEYRKEGSADSFTVKRGGTTPPVPFSEALRLISDFPGSFTVEREVVVELDLLKQAVELQNEDQSGALQLLQKHINAERQAKSEEITNEVVEVPSAPPVAEQQKEALKAEEPKELRVLKRTKKVQPEPAEPEEKPEPKLPEVSVKDLKKLKKDKLWNMYIKFYNRAEPDWKLGSKATKKKLTKAILDLQKEIKEFAE